MSLQSKLNEVRELEGQKKNHMEELYQRPGHAVRMALLKNLLTKHVESGMTFLEVGCAEGLYCDFAKKLGVMEAVGLDVSASKIARAKEAFPAINFIVKDCSNLEDYYRQFDIVLCSEVLQHMDDYKNLMAEMTACLNPDGILIVSIPNLSSEKTHVRAGVSDEMSTEELLSEVGGAGFGKQNAMWRFNSRTFAQEFHGGELSLGVQIPVHTPDGKRNVWTIISYKTKVEYDDLVAEDDDSTYDDPGDYEDTQT